jgi:hypothetical protein
MPQGIPSRLWQKKWIVSAIGAPLLILAWWLFRPEKLWINQTVNEPAPFATGADQTAGRATIYKSPSGREYLRLTDFSTSNGPDVHVLLARGEDERLRQETVAGALDSVELGSLKGNQGDQNYDLPAAADLSKYNTVAIYCERFHAVFGTATLEPF